MQVLIIGTKLDGRIEEIERTDFKAGECVEIQGERVRYAVMENDAGAWAVAHDPDMPDEKVVESFVEHVIIQSEHVLDLADDALSVADALSKALADAINNRDADIDGEARSIAHETLVKKLAADEKNLGLN